MMKLKDEFLKEKIGKDRRKVKEKIEKLIIDKFGSPYKFHKQTGFEKSTAISLFSKSSKKELNITLNLLLEISNRLNIEPSVFFDTKSTNNIENLFPVLEFKIGGKNKLKSIEKSSFYFGKFFNQYKNPCLFKFPNYSSEPFVLYGDLLLVNVIMPSIDDIDPKKHYLVYMGGESPKYNKNDAIRDSDYRNFKIGRIAHLKDGEVLLYQANPKLNTVDIKPYHEIIGQVISVIRNLPGN